MKLNPIIIFDVRSSSYVANNISHCHGAVDEPALSVSYLVHEDKSILLQFSVHQL